MDDLFGWRVDVCEVDDLVGWPDALVLNDDLEGVLVGVLVDNCWDKNLESLDMTLVGIS